MRLKSARPRRPELKTLAGVAVGTLVIAALYFGQEVLIPITLAVMLSFVLSPVVNLLQRLRLWRAPAVILTVIAALGLLGLFGALIGSQAASLTVNAPQYARTIEAKVQGVQGFAVARLASITKELGGKRPTTTPRAATPTLATPSAPTTADQRRPIPGGGRPRQHVAVRDSTKRFSNPSWARWKQRSLSSSWRYSS